MRERAHEKGRVYQRATKRWLLAHSLFGYVAIEFADAYDATCFAAEIGGEGFDFALTLMCGAEAERLLYAECKYRDEAAGRTNSEFAAYLCSVYTALTNATPDRASTAEFIFVTTVPPEQWRLFLRAPHSFVKEILGNAKMAIDDEIVAKVCSQADVIVLSQRLIGEAK